jgi:hypothetical protein
MGNPQDCERFLLAMDAVLSQSTRQPRKDAPQFVLSAIVTVHQKITPEFLRYLGFLVSEHALFLSYL